MERSESTRQLIATGVREKPPKNFKVLVEFIGHQETSSGCGLMGLGEKILSPYSNLAQGELQTLPGLPLPPAGRAAIWSLLLALKTNRTLEPTRMKVIFHIASYSHIF